MVQIPDPKKTDAKNQVAPETNPMQQVKPAQAPAVTKTLLPPSKYMVSKEDYFYVKFGLQKYQGRWLIVEEDSSPDVENHWLKFRMWSYPESVALRRKVTTYDQSKRASQIDQERLDEYKIKTLLLEWSFGERDPALKLLHVGGILSDESYAHFVNMHYNTVQYVTNRMNAILEQNN